MRDMRLNCNVTRGEIDNTQRGLVVVTLWVCGEEAPCRINLEGDCLRDLAGCKIAFTNKQFNEFQPYPVSLSALSQGVVGEITASARLYTVTKQNDLGEYENPCYTNVMRLEFFTSLGRVIFECLNFETELISLDWQMTDGEEFAQEASNFANWQAHIEATPKEELNTQPYLLSDLFDEIFQRFGNSIDFDQHEAALMGWDGTLSALADARELKPADFDQDLLLDDALLGDQFMKAIDNGQWGKSQMSHPVLESIKDLIEDFEEQAAQLTFPRGKHYLDLISTLYEIEKGVGAIINPGVSERPDDLGLSGCREYLGKMAVAFYHLSQLITVTETTKGSHELLNLRDGMLDLREEISVLRFQLHNL